MANLSDNFGRQKVASWARVSRARRRSRQLGKGARPRCIPRRCRARVFISASQRRRRLVEAPKSRWEHRGGEEAFSGQFVFLRSSTPLSGDPCGPQRQNSRDGAGALGLVVGWPFAGSSASVGRWFFSPASTRRGMSPGSGYRSSRRPCSAAGRWCASGGGSDHRAGWRAARSSTRRRRVGRNSAAFAAASFTAISRRKTWRRSGRKPWPKPEAVTRRGTSPNSNPDHGAAQKFPGNALSIFKNRSSGEDVTAENHNREEFSRALAPCPFCAGSEVEILMVLKVRHNERVFVCGNCHVEIRPPAWHCTTEADAVNFWNRCLRPAAPRD